MYHVFVYVQYFIPCNILPVLEEYICVVHLLMQLSHGLSVPKMNKNTASDTYMYFIKVLHMFMYIYRCAAKNIHIKRSVSYSYILPTQHKYIFL